MYHPEAQPPLLRNLLERRPDCHRIAQRYHEAQARRRNVRAPALRGIHKTLDHDRVAQHVDAQRLGEPVLGAQQAVAVGQFDHGFA